MAFTEYKTLSAVTVGSTELSIVSGTTTLSTDTTDGAFQLWIDAANMAKGDEFTVRLYEKVLSTGSKTLFARWSLLGVQSEVFVTPTFVLMNGWDMTITKIAGTDRAFSASVRQVA